MSQVARVQSGDHTESECHRIVPLRGDIKAEMEVARRREWGECPGQRGGGTGWYTLTMAQEEVGKVSCRSMLPLACLPKTVPAAPIVLAWFLKLPLFTLRRVLVWAVKLYGQARSRYEDLCFTDEETEACES